MSNMQVPSGQNFSNEMQQLQKLQKRAAGGSISKAEMAQAEEAFHKDPLPGGLIQEGGPSDQMQVQVPEGKMQEVIGKLFNPSEDIIDDTLSEASMKMPGAQDMALHDFHHAVENMNQKELDQMKDTLARHMSSPKSSQWDRSLLQKMYDITDAVSEHRLPPHLNEGKPHFPKFPKFPNPIDPGFPAPFPGGGGNIDPGFYIDLPNAGDIDPGFSRQIGGETGLGTMISGGAINLQPGEFGDYERQIPDGKGPFAPRKNTLD